MNHRFIREFLLTFSLFVTLFVATTTLNTSHWRSGRRGFNPQQLRAHRQRQGFSQ
jgi:hypothetical protein